MKRSFNSKTAAILFVSLIVVSGGLFGLHSLQAGRNAELFLDAARSEVEQEKIADAVKSYRSYLRLKPSDAAAQAELGKLLFDTGSIPAAYSVLEQALVLNPGDVDSRRMAAEAALAMRRHTDLVPHLLKLFEVTSEDHVFEDENNDDGRLGKLTGNILVESTDAELFDWLGQAKQGTGQFQPAEIAYRHAIKCDKNRVETYYRLAYLYQRELERPNEATALLSQLIEENADSADAHMVVAQYHLLRSADAEKRGETDAIKTELEQAKAAAEIAHGLDEAKIDTLALLAECHLRLGNPDEARKFAEIGREKAPAVAQWYTILANVESMSGNSEAALRQLRDGAKSVETGVEDVLGNLANLLLDRAAASDESEKLIEEADGVVKRLRTLGTARELVSYLQGRVYFADGQWLDASRALENIRPEFDGNATIQKQIDFWLGQCYGELGKHDLQLLAFQRAARVDPLWIRARVGVISALSALNRSEQAERELSEVMRLPGAPPQGWLDLVRISIRKNSRAGADADWSVTEQLLAEAERRMPGSHSVTVTRADYLIVQEKIDEAKQLLSAARQSSPDKIESWLSEMRLYRSLNDAEQYDALFKEATKKFGDVPALRVEQAVTFLQRSNEESRENVVQELRRLAEPNEAFTPDERMQVSYALAQLGLSLREFDFAEDLLAKVSEHEPNNLRLWLLRFDVALQKRDPSAMPELLAKIKEIEGEDALWHYGTALRLRLTAEDDDPEILQRALEHIAAAKTKRANWDRLALLAGEIRMALGETDAAMASYVEAIDYGVRDPAILKSAIQYLLLKKDEKKAGEIAQLLDQQPSLLAGDTELMNVVSRVSQSLNKSDRALELARQAAEQSQGYDDNLWLAQLLMVQVPLRESTDAAVAAERDEAIANAEQALRRTIEIEPARPQAWVLLVQLLSRLDRQDEAEQVVKEAEAKIAAEDLPRALAQCYLQMGQLDNARQQYADLLKASPNDPSVVETVADFHLNNLRRIGGLGAAQEQASPEAIRQERQTTEELMRRLLKLTDASKSQKDYAERNLAIISLARGDITGLNDALTLTDEALKKNPDDVASLRVRALALSLQNSPERRQEAIATYEKLLGLTGDDSAPEDRFAMANLYQQNDDFRAASRVLQTLVGQTANPDHRSHRNHAFYLTRYVSTLLRLNELGAAEEWLRRLEQMTRESNPLPAQMLRVEMESRRERHQQAIEELIKLTIADEPSETVGPAPPSETGSAPIGLTPTQIASQFEYLATLPEPKPAKENSSEIEKARHAASERERIEDIKRIYWDAAEQVLRDHADESPQQQLQLAAFLVRHKRQGEALDMVEKVAEVLKTAEDLPVMSEAMFMVLESDEPTVEDVVRVSRVLDRLRAEHAESPILLMVLARVLDLQKDETGAQNAYRAVIKAQPNNVVAMNNLALMLLADKTNLTEAGELSDRTIAEAGPVPTLLDTRAMIAIAAGDYKLALDNLNKAIAQSADSNYLFHRAVVYQRLGNDKAALADFRQVDPRELRENRLISLEQRWLVELRRLSPRGA